MTELKEEQLDLDVMDNWLLWDGCKQTDFLLLEWDSLPKLHQQDDVIYEYNQWTSQDCTIYSAIGAVSDLMNYKFSAEEIKEINELSYQKWRIRGNGWYIYMAVDLVRNWWNANRKELWRIASYRVDLRDDELVDQILDKGYTLCSWYQWNYKYNTDFSADDKLDGSEFGEKTYGHAVCWRKVDWVRSIKDNYKWRSYKWVDTNIYTVIPSCSQLVNDNTYYVNAYLFMKLSEVNREELQRLEKMKSLLNVACEAHSALRHLTNDETYKEFLHKINEQHRSKIHDCDVQKALHS